MDETKRKRPWWRRLRTWIVAAHVAVTVPALLWACFVYSMRYTFFRPVYDKDAPNGGEAYRFAIRGAESLAGEMFWPLFVIAGSSAVLAIALLGTLSSDENRP